MTDDPTTPETAPPAPRRGLRRMLGLDRSGPPPRATLPGNPLNPWTIPNAVGYARLVGLVLFLIFALSSGDGQSDAATVLYALVAWGDYLDGIAARATGQYSRLGALMDPVIDRLMIISGAAICLFFELLPVTALLLLLGRELVMLAMGRYALRRRGALTINWLGRIGVWPIMAAIFLGLAGARHAGEILIWIGLALAYASSAMYAKALIQAPAVGR